MKTFANQALMLPLGSCP